MLSPKAPHVAYWLTTGLTALLFAVPGAALLARQPHFASEMARLGYPGYFLTILGSLKLLGAFVVLAPDLKRLKEWAYAGMVFDVACAVLSRVGVGDSALTLLVPIAAGLMVLLSWALRPPSRTLGALPVMMPSTAHGAGA
jgi:hypothetical protein